jgi:hypothetical protein
MAAFTAAEVVAMKSLEDILGRVAELCDVDETERSFSPEVINRAHDLMVSCHATPVGRPTVQTLLAFAEALVECQEDPSDNLSLTERDEMLLAIALAHGKARPLYGRTSKCVCVYCEEVRERKWSRTPGGWFPPPKRSPEDLEGPTVEQQMVAQMSRALAQGHVVELKYDGKVLSTFYPEGWTGARVSNTVPLQGRAKFNRGGGSNDS